MSGKIPLQPLYPEYLSESPENESAIKHECAIPTHAQLASFGFSPHVELVSGRGDPSSPHPIPSERSSNPKVPIPRTTRPVTWTSSSRVGRACENCRDQKAKCSGHRPSCQRCQDAGVSCSYSDRKREKMVKQLEEFTTQVNTYETLLRDLYPRLDPSLAQHVEQTLRGQRGQLVKVRFHGLPIPYLPFSYTPPDPIKIPSAEYLIMSPSVSFSEVGTSSYPLAAIDHTTEDFNRDEKVQAMGFVGEHSEMAWLYKLKRDLDYNSTIPASEAPDRESVSISSLNYFEDDTEILNLDSVDISKRPPQHIADTLVNVYFQSVHPAFPIIGKGIFLGQYRSFYTNPNVRPGKRWIAVLNLVFAIATRYSKLVGNGAEGDDNDHLMYFARAWQLGRGNVALLEHPNLQQVQVEGLSAFYLLSTGQINRAWRIIGIAIRSAVAMGLNLRSETESIAQVSKETRYRVWWALFMLDIVLCAMTGRPPSTETFFCTTPLPIPYIEEDFETEGVVQLIGDLSIRNNLLTALLISGGGGTPKSSDASTDYTHGATTSSKKGKEAEQTANSLTDTITPNISLHFLYGVDLAFLMRDAIQTLYAPGTTRRSWIEMEVAISNLNAQADHWLSRLPAEFHFTKLDAPSTDPFVRQRISLGFRFYTTKLIISQPCLRHLAYQVPGSGPSGALCGTMAAMCVQVASAMLNMLPSEPDAPWLFGISPWWCILHYIMQSMTILLIELFARTQPGTPEAARLVAKVQKAARWLREMSTKDQSSHRAWLVCMDILSRHGEKFGFEIDDIL
ncbi:uncharacterized protein N7482_007698 [Penicillium canariense]|uniref:Zn(2)-C6 fungal-type domain-containing protein n=1 Tax=Penicillium canariense TaxID=189055 RepID=A0A9W9HXA5_9EURO|nr:uncharacterized protein N7482_007698 [Penicillium canariense]KAJ5160694.1 hypothetical protein N7482_007698 [Penicillium canariense]